ncbi:MAG: class I SAM-dependent methyltransferase [Flavobacteriales bacterium]
MGKDDAYLNTLRADRTEAHAYHTKSVVKTEQQKALEHILQERGFAPKAIGDMACGGGSLSHHLRSAYPDAQFTLCDMDPYALELAEQLNGRNGFTYLADDLNSLEGLADGRFDLTFCWQTLLMVVEPATVLRQLVRVTRPGGSIFCSSLFNLDHDVDLRTAIIDHTRPSAASGEWMVHYATYSRRTIASWLDGIATAHWIHPFVPAVDIQNDSKGLGTFTVNSDRGRLQISGGILMNWGILEIRK